MPHKRKSAQWCAEFIFLLLTLSFLLPQQAPYSAAQHNKNVPGSAISLQLQEGSVMRGPETKDLLYLPLVVFSYVTLSLFIVHKSRGVPFSYENNGTDLTFSSSDGGWRAEEDMLNGKNFDSLLVSFELYRLRCKKDSVQLLRTKPKKNFWKWAWWFDNYSSPKWYVPYVPADSITNKDTTSCPQRAYTAEEKMLARERARTLRQALVTP